MVPSARPSSRPNANTYPSISQERSGTPFRVPLVSSHCWLQSSHILGWRAEVHHFLHLSAMAEFSSYRIYTALFCCHPGRPSFLVQNCQAFVSFTLTTTSLTHSGTPLYSMYSCRASNAVWASPPNAAFPSPWLFFRNSSLNWDKHTWHPSTWQTYALVRLHIGLLRFPMFKWVYFTFHLSLQCTVTPQHQRYIL